MNNNVFYFLLFLINFIQSQCIVSFLYSIEKILNYRYYINIYKLLYFEGLFGFLIMILGCGIYTIFDHNYIFNNFEKVNNRIIDLFIFLYFIFFIF